MVESSEVSIRKVDLQKFITDNRDLLIVFGVFTALGRYFLDITSDASYYIATLSFILAGYLGLIVLDNYDKIHRRKEAKLGLDMFFFVFLVLILSIFYYVWISFKDLIELFVRVVIIAFCLYILLLIVSVLFNRRI